MEEVWKDVQGYEHLFKVSNLGNVFSKRSNKILKQHSRSDGRKTVATRIGGRLGETVCFKVHRLVATAFIDNPEDKPFVNHIDGDPSNNRLDNLEWATSSENVLHAFKTGLNTPSRGEDNVQAKLDNDIVVFIRENYIPRDREFGARALSRKFSVSKETVRNVLLNKTWSHV